MQALQINHLRIELHLIIHYITSWDTDLDRKLVRDFIYLLQFQFRNSGLLLWPRFKLVDPEREPESFSGNSVNVLLWVQQWWVTDKASRSLKWFISECSQAPIILLLKGDSIFSKNKELLQNVRELALLKALGVINGSIRSWSNLEMFKKLEFVHFAPKEKYRRDDEKFLSTASRTIWTISSTVKTRVVIDPSVYIDTIGDKKK
jgi:hypothetical protein